MKDNNKWKLFRIYTSLNHSLGGGKKKKKAAVESSHIPSEMRRSSLEYEYKKHSNNDGISEFKTIC